MNNIWKRSYCATYNMWASGSSFTRATEKSRLTLQDASYLGLCNSIIYFTSDFLLNTLSKNIYIISMQFLWHYWQSHIQIPNFFFSTKLFFLNTVLESLPKTKLGGERERERRKGKMKKNTSKEDNDDKLYRQSQKFHIQWQNMKFQTPNV